jgi:hypothetical protein
MFGSTYVCEQFVSLVNSNETQSHSRLTDGHKIRNDGGFQLYLIEDKNTPGPNFTEASASLRGVVVYL